MEKVKDKPEKQLDSDSYKTMKIENKRNLSCKHPKLPTKEGEIDWDAVSYDYHKYILSPFAPEMTTRTAEGISRNQLLNYLYKIDFKNLSNRTLADFGCGPGNLLPHIEGLSVTVVGVDQSAIALEVASKKADRLGISFEGIRANLENLNLNRLFDIIICVNSILPPDRKTVVKILQRIKLHLSNKGKLLAILPSFDTTEYLKQLCYSQNVKLFGASSEQANKAYRDFDILKKVDKKNFAYADCPVPRNTIRNIPEDIPDRSQETWS